MLTIYKKEDLPVNGIVRINDVYFNQYTARLLDERAADVIKAIDYGEYVSKAGFRSRFNNHEFIGIDKLSTGCKTALNVMYNPGIIFSINECGDNAIDYIFSLDEGQVCSSVSIALLDMKPVRAVDNGNIRIISDVSELWEWLSNENEASYC